MSFAEQSLSEFTEVLASKAAVPGGGGASALVGAVGTALSQMVGNLTVGKKKFADVEENVYDIMRQAGEIQQRLLTLVDEDAAAFEPLAKAYSIPKDDPERDAVMEEALVTASSVPLKIMRCCCRAIHLHGELVKKCSVLAISDVGVGVVCCKAALMGASLNVFINTKSMNDRIAARKIENEANEMLSVYCARADEIYLDVITKLK